MRASSIFFYNDDDYDYDCDNNDNAKIMIIAIVLLILSYSNNNTAAVTMLISRVLRRYERGRDVKFAVAMRKCNATGLVCITPCDALPAE